MLEELAAVEGCTPPKHQRYAEERCSNADCQRNYPIIATMPPGPGQRNIREVPPERDTGSPADHRNRPANPSAPPALRNHGTVEEMERLIRTTRATHRGSSECSPSSTGTSHATQHSHHFYHSHRSHATRNVSRDGSRHGSWHCSRHSHRGRHGSRHRSRSRGISIPCCVPKFKRGQIPINLWSQQMVYYFSISGVGERNHVMCRINHFETKHFPEGQPYKIFSCPEFWKKIISIFRTTDLIHVHIKELMSAQQKSDVSVFQYMGRVQDNGAKAFSKIADANRQELAVSMFCQGIRDQEFARMTAIQANGGGASAISIAASRTAFGNTQHYPNRYEPRWHR